MFNTRRWLAAVTLMTVALLAPSGLGQIAWIGGTDDQWTTAANWSPPDVPDIGASVVIPAGVEIHLDPGGGTYTVNDFSCGNGSTVHVDSGELRIEGGADLAGTFTIHVSTGTLTFPNNTTSWGIINVNAGGTLNIGGELTLVPATSFNGTVNFTNPASKLISTWQDCYFYPASTSGDVRLVTDPGSFVVNDDQVLHSVHFKSGGGTLFGSGTITITDSVLWEGNGRFWGGTWEFPASVSSFTITGSGYKTMTGGAILNVHCDMTMDTTESMQNGGSTVNIHSGGSFTVHDPVNFAGGSPGVINVMAGGVFDAQGVAASMTKNDFTIQTGGVAHLGAPVADDPNGFMFDHGTITLEAGGQLHVHDRLKFASATVHFYEEPIAATGAPDLVFDKVFPAAAAALFHAHNLDIAGFDHLTFIGLTEIYVYGACRFEVPCTMHLGRLWPWNAGDSLTCTEAVTLQRIHVREHGTFRTEGPVAIEKDPADPYAYLYMQSTVGGSGRWEIAGPVTINDTVLVDRYGSFLIEVQSGGRFDVGVGMTVDFNDSGADDLLRIQEGGILRVRNGSSLTVQNGPILNEGGIMRIFPSGTLTATGSTSIDQNAGSTQVRGTLAMSGSNPFNLNGGALLGTGAITGNGVSQTGGFIRPGTNKLTPGTLTIDSLFQDAAGDCGIAIDIVHPNSDKIVVGSATIADNLNVRYRGGSTPPTTGDTYSVIVGPYSGSFTSVNGACAGQFIANYDVGGVDVEYAAECGVIAPPPVSSTTLPASGDVEVHAVMEEESGPLSGGGELVIAGSDGGAAAVWREDGGAFVEAPLPDLGGASSVALDIGVDSFGMILITCGGADNGGTTVPVRWEWIAPGAWMPADPLPQGPFPGGEATTIGLLPGADEIIGGWARNAANKKTGAVWTGSPGSFLYAELPLLNLAADEATVTDLSRGDVPLVACGVETTGSNSQAVVWTGDENGQWTVEGLAPLAGGSNTYASCVAGWTDSETGGLRIHVAGWADDAGGLRMAAEWEWDEDTGWLGPVIYHPVGADESEFMSNTATNRILGDDMNDILGDDMNDILGDDMNDFRSLGSTTTAGIQSAAAWYGHSQPQFADLNDYAPVDTLLTRAVALGRQGTIIANGLESSPLSGADVPVGVVLSPISCPEDLTGAGGVPDLVVDVQDLLFLLGAWGTPAGDIDGDGDTNVIDLLAVLGAWGPCG